MPYFALFTKASPQKYNCNDVVTGGIFFMAVVSKFPSCIGPIKIKIRYSTAGSFHN